MQTIDDAIAELDETLQYTTTGTENYFILIAEKNKLKRLKEQGAIYVDDESLSTGRS